MLINWFFKVFICHLFFCLFYNCEHEILKVSSDSHENFIFLATIDGNIHLLNRHTGELKWSNKLSPFIKTTSTNGSMLIPNPINGQLYIFHHNEHKDVFSPLEYSLYEYVKKTPLFMENLLLTGSKSDQWLSIDFETGQILHKYQMGNVENCPQHNANELNRTMYIGICQYNLVVSDPTSRQQIYHVVLNSLATHSVTDLDGYDMRHYASSDSGLVVTKYKTDETGWSVTLDSSIIGFYSITSQGVLSRLKFTSMSHDTLSFVFLDSKPWNHYQFALKKAMFFGHASNGWYVLKTFIHQDQKVKSNIRQQLPLITGPVNGSLKYQHFYHTDEAPANGFYELPIEKYLSHQNRVITSNYLLDFDKHQLNNSLVSKDINNTNVSKFSVYVEPYTVHIRFICILVAATFLMVVYIAYFITRQKSIEKKSRNSGMYYGRELMYKTVDSKYDSDNDEIIVGELSYHAKQVLGFGTNGTAVFRGVFLGHNRPVAVKRLLNSEKSHYELQFLRQSFDCNHLIKCFYITQSREFTFLALELCECTLEEYTSNSSFRDTCGLDKLNVCKQMIIGVHFLHDKGIVHRDLKPRNVLIMKQHKLQLRPNSNNNNNSPDSFNYKIVISDFGLSRQSVDWGISITKTGCGGTPGYMAPELTREDVKRISTKSDIFSCGILFYYVFTDGQHPFGNEIMSRQHRIHQGKVQLDRDLIQNRMLPYLVSFMLRSTPNERPSADEILRGPLFWKPLDKLSFLCDVSDYIEKNDVTLQMSLDKRSSEVYTDRWIDILDLELIDCLTKERSYRPKNLSHLARAIRNKRNHFHEIPVDLSRRLFNSDLDGFAAYIDERFPNLYVTLYEWVSGRLDLFPNSIHHYFPASLPLKTEDLANSSDNCVDDATEDNNDEEIFLEWRKAKRKRPSHAKKIRGSKSDKKISDL